MPPLTLPAADFFGARSFALFFVAAFLVAMLFSSRSYGRICGVKPLMPQSDLYAGRITQEIDSTIHFASAMPGQAAQSMSGSLP